MKQKSSKQNFTYWELCKTNFPVEDLDGQEPPQNLPAHQAHRQPGSQAATAQNEWWKQFANHTIQYLLTPISLVLPVCINLSMVLSVSVHMSLVVPVSNRMSQVLLVYFNPRSATATYTSPIKITVVVRIKSLVKIIAAI